MKHLFVVLGLALASVVPSALDAQTAPANIAMVADDQFDRLVADVKASMQASPEKALAAAQRVKTYARGTGNPRTRRIMEITADWLIGEAQTRVGANAIAKPIISSALRAVRNVAPGTQLHANILLTDGGVNTAFGDVKTALIDLQQAHHIFRTIGDNRGQARALIQIAMLYFDANDFQSSVKYETQASEVLVSDPGIAVSIHNGLGNAYSKLQQFGDAEREYEKALSFARELDSRLLIATILNNLARVRLAAHQLTIADRTITESLRYAGPDAPEQTRQQQLAIAAQLALQQGSLPRAKALLEEVFAGADLARTTLADREAHETAYNVYRRLAEPTLALAHLAALKRLDDDATALARSNSAALMSARFDFANQELRITQLKADDLQKSVGYERTRARTQRMIFFGVVSAILTIAGMLLFALVTIRRSRNQVRSVNAELEIGNAALAKALAAKSEFLAVTSHEIRTPLNGILGMTQVMLADSTLDPVLRDRVGVVHGAGTTMRALVDDILDVAKIETGNLTIERIAFDFREMLRQSCRLWDEAARAKGIAFTLQLDDCPTMIEGDPARVRQILFNLLGNAVKFTADGEIRVGACRGIGERVHLTVRDSGIGIPLDKQIEIFESFRQVDAGTTRQYGGTGLGLSICRNLARAMGGDVTVESVAGEGATFLLDLPLVEPGQVAEASTQASVPAYLVIDRNPIGRAMYRALLLDVADAVETADGMVDALRFLGRGNIVGVVVDEATLGSDGDAVANARALVEAAQAAHVNILLPRDDAEAVALAATGAHVLAKPIARAQLVAHVATQLAAGAESRLVTQAA